jgi:hypothetical protein
MQSFLFDHDGRDIPVNNPLLIFLMSILVVALGYRAYFVEHFFDNLLFLMFFTALVAFWRCLSIRKLEEVTRDGTKRYKIRLHGMFVLVFLTILSLVRAACVLIICAVQTSEPQTQAKFEALFFLVNGTRQNLTRSATDVKWSLADSCLVMLITFAKSKLKLTITEKFQTYIRNYYKSLNFIFTMISYPFLGFEALSNPLYIFIIYLVLRNKISSGEQETWTNTNNLIGILRYFILFIMALTSLTAQSIYRWLGAEERKVGQGFNNGFYMDVLFFMTCHLCVYFGSLYRTIPKQAELPTRNCMVPKSAEFSESLFDRYFLGNWMPVMTSSHFAYTANYYATNISTIRKAFEPDPLINEHVLKLKIKQETHKYKWIKRLAIKVSCPY